MTKLVIGIAGLAGSGKSVIAQSLLAQGFRRIKMADPLKNMLRELYRTVGLDSAEIERRIEGDLKEEPDEILGGQSPRHAMITLGTEWGRELIHPALWSDAWARAALASKAPVVVDDIRFANEQSALRALGGYLIQVRRPGVTARDHVSESMAGLHPDVIIDNEGTEVDLWDDAEDAYQHIVTIDKMRRGV